MSHNLGVSVPVRCAVALAGCLAATLPLSATGSAAAVPTAARQAPVTVEIGTYNVQKDSASRPWSERRTKVAQLVRDAMPDVLGIQEANGPHRGSALRFPARDLGRLLPGYATVATRDHRGTRELSTSGRYLLYRDGRLGVRRSGEIDLGQSARAVWAEFADRPTGRRFVVVNAHLVNGNTAARDRVRRAQTRRLIAATRRVGGGLPAVLVGDYNSHARHASDAPTKVLRQAGWVDSYRVAQRRSKGAYNSNNQLRRTPPRKRLHVDYVYAPRGATVTSWAQGLRLTGQRFRGTIPSDHNPVFATLRLR